MNTIERKKRCCIVTCRGERFDLSHKFPRCQEAAESWLRAINDPLLFNVNFKKLSDSYQVCARHFKISDYKHPQSRSLNKLAVPSLNLTNLNKLHLARDSTPCETEVTILDEDIIQNNRHKNPDKNDLNDKLCLGFEDKNKNNEENYSNDDTSFIVYPESNTHFDSITGISRNYLQKKNQLAFNNEECQPEENIDLIDSASESMDLDSTCIKNEYNKETNINKTPDITTMFAIFHTKYEHPITVNAFWLRCQCPCSECFDPQTKRKKLTPMNIPKEIKPKDIQQVVSSDMLIVEWNDGHISTFDPGSLFNIDPTSRAQEKHHFDVISLLKTPQIEVLKLISFDDSVNETFQNLSLYGFICVTNVSTKNNSTMAKLVIERLFPHLQTIHFEQFNENHSSISTNITCANFDCGLKCFLSKQKMEIILVDGLNVADKLKKHDVHAFELLANTQVPFQVRDNNVFHQKIVPIIDKSNESIEIQLDMHTLGALNTIPQEKIGSFYESLEKLMTVIENENNQILLTLQPGTMIILDNRRVLHKIVKNNETLQCYIGRNNFIGRLRYLELL